MSHHKARVKPRVLPWLLFAASSIILVIGARPVGGQVSLKGIPRYDVEMDQRLGAFDDPVLAFSRISDLALGPDGNLYLVQPMEREVTVLSPSGELVRRIGRKGRGPGEFLTPGTLGWRGDTLWVSDMGSRRITYFLGDEVQRTRTVRVASPRRGWRVVMARPWGDRFMIGLLAGRFTEPPGHPNNAFALIAVDGSDRVRDTVATLQENAPLRVRRENLSTSPPFVDFPVFDISRDGRFALVLERPFPEGESAEIRLTVLVPPGDTVASRVLRSPAIRITDRQWDARLDERFAILPNSELTRKDLTEFRPEAYAPASHLFTTGNGAVWIGREEVYDSEQRTWVVLDRDLNPRFEVVLPRAFSAYDATDDEIWGVETDEFGVPYVVRYRIQKGRD